MDIFTTIIDLIAPRRPSQVIVDTITADTVVDLIQIQHIQHTTCLLPYHHLTVQSLITENKFHHSLTARTLLAHALSNWLAKHLPRTSIWLVPIPLSPIRESARGYNQVQIITELVARQHQQSQTVPLLIRTRDTTPQTTLGRTERLQNMGDAFSLAPDSGQWLRTPPEVIIVVDDVLTTGATMAAARATLVTHLPPTTTLRALAIAH